MRSTGLKARYWFATLALGAVVAAAPAWAQSQDTTPQGNNDGMRADLAAMDHFMDSDPKIAEQLRKDPSLVDNKQFVSSHPALQQFLESHPQVAEEYKENPNAFMHREDRYDQREDRRNVAVMDRFLDSHPEIAQQLQKQPGLVDNKEFVSSHPALQQFLASHPDVSQDFKENPTAFMRQEDQFDARGNSGMSANGNSGMPRNGSSGAPRNNDGMRADLAAMDHFMDSDPKIAEQLRKDPSLVDNKQFVSSHPALQQFLASHPQVAEEYKENPNAFMHREDRYDEREDRRNVAVMDRFLDSHPEIAEQLQKKPGLVDNKEFVSSHPALQQFLASHPDVSQDFKENPTAFMRQEDQFDARGNSYMHRNNDVTGVSSFHEFMEGHGAIAGELSKNPMLATNQEYLENHPELKTYLQAHPNVNEELSENPQSFVKSAQQPGTPGTSMTKPTTEPKMK